MLKTDQKRLHISSSVYLGKHSAQTYVNVLALTEN